MSQYVKLFLLSIFAGLSISLGASFYLIIPNNYSAAAAFSLGIILVMAFEFKLFTGVIPKQFQLNQSVFENITIYCGNIIGTWLFALLCQSSSKYSQIYTAAARIISLKTDIPKVCIAAIGCGIIIGLIVNIKIAQLKYILSIPLIMIFILLGFEHCIADNFYMLVSNQFNPLILLAVTVGNIIGGLFVSLGMECYNK